MIFFPRGRSPSCLELKFSDLKNPMEKYQGTKFKTFFVLKKTNPPIRKIKEINKWCKKFASLDMVPAAGGGFCGNSSFRNKISCANAREILCERKARARSEAKNPRVISEVLSRASFLNKEGFFITASFANLANLKKEDFVEVLNCAASAKEVTVNGKKPPSSETFLHYLIYKNRPDVNVIFHVHDEKIINNAQRLAREFKIPVTKEEKPYGTIELAQEVKKVLGKNNYVIMKNHGVIGMGKDVNKAGEVITKMREEIFSY